MTKKPKIIRGAGGGPKTPPPPFRAPDTLHSRQFATVQDLISEGEIFLTLTFIFSAVYKNRQHKSTDVSIIKISFG